ncbi:trans-sialidase, putative [Trypanosoma cruzi marinkellei]|uniref:Trans-sialidase, putative n=1 Tax=Trypanosoma cruzi marinkellei TaxID=85056 RepID=K2NRN1_TRYCR|nr:trans-sialidase, putative [Trypanosoma cruzi marinkellei]
MLPRVAAVKAPRKHNRRRVTGSGGRRREGRESERQRPNMSRHVFHSAVLLLLIAMMCCGSEAAAAEENSDSMAGPKFAWRDINEKDESVESLGVPGLLKVGTDVFAVAEAQCKKDGSNIFTGVASMLLTTTTDNKPEEVLNDAKKHTQVLEKTGSQVTKTDVSRPTTVVNGSDIYMLAGNYSQTAATNPKEEGGAVVSGLLLVKGEVRGSGESKKIHWKATDDVPRKSFGEQDSLMQLVGGGGSGVKMEDGTLVFPVEGTKKKGESENNGKTVSLLMYTSDDSGWKLSKGMSDGGCSDPSVVEWEKDKLMMMTACDGGCRRVYEIGDKGESWTEALGTLSRVWGNKHKGNEKGVGSGFITATVGGDQKKVMLVTLPVYSKEKEDKEKEKSELHLWLTDNTHIVDIGPVSEKGEDDVTASSLLYESGEGEDNNNEDKLIALYEKKKKKGDGGINTRSLVCASD